MGNRAREVNRITTTIISISVKLMVYALVILLLYEAIARDYASDHETSFAEAVDEAPGQDMIVWIDSKESVSNATQFLTYKGLIKNEFAFIFQSRFYDCETIYPGTYTLNTPMAPKEIPQLLNGKSETEDSAKPVQSGGAKAAEAKIAQGRTSEGGNGGSATSDQETSPETTAVPSSDASVPADAAPGSQAGTSAIDAQEVQVNEQTHKDEDRGMEGGWIEDAAEDGTQ